MPLDKDQWLIRYRSRLKMRRPDLSSFELDLLAGSVAFDELSAEYPDNPETAIDEDFDAE
jgi:hypothetical protein